MPCAPRERCHLKTIRGDTGTGSRDDVQTVPFREAFMRYGLLAAGIVLVGMLPGGASAQWNNQPFQLRNASSLGNTVGMSMAYRQAILERKFTGATPDQLFRDATGALLTVERRGNLAILREPVGAFLPMPHGSGATLNGIGFATVGSVDASYRALGTWTGMLSNPDSYQVARASLGPASTSSVNAWISQLDDF